MAKKLVSLLCAVAMLVTMVSIAAFSASADEIVLDKSMKSLAEATVTPIYGTSTKYSIASTGTFTDATYGDGFVSESWSNIGQGVNIDYGNYSMEAFEFGAILGFRNMGKNDSQSDYQEIVTLKVGDVTVVFTYHFYYDQDKAEMVNQEYLVSATYKDAALPLMKKDGSEFTKTAWGNTGAKYGDKAYKDVHAAMLAARGVTSGFSVAGKWPNLTQPVKLGYANGVLTLYTGSGNSSTWKAAATAALADADFSNANVSLTLTAGKGSWYVHNIQGAYKQLSASEPEPVHGANLVIGESVTPVFLFKEEALGGNAAADLTATVSVSGLVKDLALVQDGEIYKVVCDFITPDTFGESITVSLKDAEGNTVDSFDYSVKTYCENKFASGSDYLKALLRDILVYGEGTRQFLIKAIEEGKEDKYNLDKHTVPTTAISLVDGMDALPATTYPTDAAAPQEGIEAEYSLNLTGKVSINVTPWDSDVTNVVVSNGTAGKEGNKYVVPVSFLDVATSITFNMYKGEAEAGSFELSVSSILKAYFDAYSGSEENSLGEKLLGVVDGIAKVSASSYAYNASLVG